MKKERLKSAIVLIALFLAFLTACKKDGGANDPFLQQTSDELYFDWEGGEKGFAITTNGGSWTVSAPDADWITFDVTAGEGKGTRESVLASVAPNRGDIREGKILIQAGGQRSEITVRQGDGRISFGEVSLDLAAFNLGESIEDAYLTFPYQRGIPGDELKFSVVITGDGSVGINPVVDFPMILEDPSGEISIPLSGNPTSTGEVIFTVTLTDNIHGITMPSPIFREVFDPNQPHPDALPFVISGYMQDPQGGDGNYEYVQLLALQDIVFNSGDNAYSIVFCNNAGTTAVPGADQLDRRQDFPADGWATGNYTINGTNVLRTYKINITSGTVSKGQYFYVGGINRKINGETSTGEIPANRSIVARDYVSLDGDDGIGNANSGLLANSGLTSGIAVFKGTAVEHDTEPMDVIFIGGTPTSATASVGALYGTRSYDPFNGVTRGYRITNTDHYNTADGNYFTQGNNTWRVAYPGSAAVQGVFHELRGVYNVVTATWATPRSRNAITLSTGSAITAIETENSTKMFPAP